MHNGNNHFQAAINRLTHLFAARGSDTAHAVSQAHALVYQGMQRQASMLSFVDNFRIMSIICLCVIPLMFLMKARRSKGGDAPPMH
jgi:DHA2 family multidrug resistance protein